MTAQLLTSDGVVAFGCDGFSTEPEAVAFLRGLCLALDLPEDWMGKLSEGYVLSWQWQSNDVYEVLKLPGGPLH